MNTDNLKIHLASVIFRLRLTERFKDRRVSCCGCPDFFLIYIAVIMYNDVPHALDRVPVDFAKSCCPQFFGELSDKFPICRIQKEMEC